MQQDVEFETLRRFLNDWDRRRRYVELLSWLPRGLLVTLLISAVIATVIRFFPLLTNQELVAFMLVLALLGIGFTLVVVLLRRRTLLEQARYADQKFGLLERASTAVEISAGQVDTTPLLAREQLADTVRVANLLEARILLPLQVQWRDLLIVLVSVVLLAAAVLLPNPQEAILEEQRAVSKAIADQAEALESLVEEIRQNPALSDDQEDELLAPIQDALETLQDGDPGREEAVAALSEAQANLRELSQSRDTTILEETLQGAGGPLAESRVGQSLGEALQNGDFAAASMAANQLADNLINMPARDRDDLARALAEAAVALQTADPELAAQFREAADALRDNDTESAQQALRDAAATLQERAQEQAAARQAADAAEALEQGRSEVAQAGRQPQTGQGQQGQGQGSSAEGGNQGQGSGTGQDGDQSSSLEQGSPSDQDDGAGGPGPGGGHAESVYVPDFADLSDEAGVEIELPAECVANPENCGALISETPLDFGEEESLVPYDQVFGDYREAAYQALDQDYVPLVMKDIIRDYFTSLEP